MAWALTILWQDSKGACNQHLRAKAVGPASPHGDCVFLEWWCGTSMLESGIGKEEVWGCLHLSAPMLCLTWLDSEFFKTGPMPCLSTHEAHRKHELLWSLVMLRQGTTAVGGWTYFHVDNYWENPVLQLPHPEMTFPVQADGLGVSVSMPVSWPQADSSSPMWHKIHIEKIYMID